MPIPTDIATLRRLFSGLTEQTFIAELGLTDTRLVDYLSELLTRFIHRDSIFAVRSADGRRLEQLALMMGEAERDALSRDARREIFRHMGDFALFWTGVYPEALRKQAAGKDALVDYSEQGKRSYYIASTYSDTPTQKEEAPILRRLSAEFELCAFGLRQVRNHLEQPRSQD
jgi:hypothetical protein